MAIQTKRIIGKIISFVKQNALFFNREKEYKTKIPMITLLTEFGNGIVQIRSNRQKKEKS